MKKPLIIGIGGTHSGAGKTTLAAAILEYLTKSIKDSNKLRVTSNELKNKNKDKDNNSLLVTRHSSLVTQKRWGAIKYTKTSSLPSIVTDREILMKRDKDTCRMMGAGASEVLWVQSPRPGLGKVLPEALKRLSYLDGIIVEGNSAIEFLNPDIVIFIIGGDKKRWKPCIERLITIADIILYESEAEPPKISGTTKLFHKSLLDKKEYRGFFELISSLLNEKRAKSKVE